MLAHHQSTAHSAIQNNTQVSAIAENCEATLKKILNQLQDGQFYNEQRGEAMIYLRDCLPYLQFITFSQSRTLFNLLWQLANELCDWQFLIKLYQEFPTFLPDKNRAQATLELINYYLYMGYFQQAKTILEGELLAEPHNKYFNDYWKSLNSNYQHWLSTEHELANHQIRLVPLQHYHIYGFSWQYSQSTVELCNLPNFTSENDWYYWLESMQEEKNRILFAIIHQEWGFIGSVSLQVFRDVGFFYYWLGEDFQGKGYGPEAVEILLRYGQQHMGMQCCYAKVYDYNTPSHKAVNKLGFSCLPINALEPDHQEVFYYKGAPKTDSEHFQELGVLLDDMESGIQITPALKAGHF